MLPISVKGVKDCAMRERIFHRLEHGEVARGDLLPDLMIWEPASTWV